MLPLAVLSTTSPPVSALTVHYPGGFSAESDADAGLAHFAEHMVMTPCPWDPELEVQLEKRGYLLAAQTRKDCTRVSLVGPHDGFPDAAERLLQHLAEPDRRAQAEETHQAQVIRGEVLAKTQGRPSVSATSWPMGIMSQAQSGLTHDPYFEPGMRASYRIGGWQEFARSHLNLNQSSIGVVLGRRAGTPHDLADRLHGTWHGPQLPVVPAPPDTAEVTGWEEVRYGDGWVWILPIRGADPEMTFVALVAACSVAMVGLEMLRGRTPLLWRYGLFDEWFSEQVPTSMQILTPRAPGPEEGVRLDRLLDRIDASHVARAVKSVLARIQRDGGSILRGSAQLAAQASVGSSGTVFGRQVMEWASAASLESLQVRGVLGCAEQPHPAHRRAAEPTSPQVTNAFGLPISLTGWPGRLLSVVNLGHLEAAELVEWLLWAERLSGGHGSPLMMAGRGGGSLFTVQLDAVPLAPNGEVTLVLDCTSDPGDVVQHATLLRQALTAIDHQVTNADGEALRLATRAAVTDPRSLGENWRRGPFRHVPAALGASRTRSYSVVDSAARERICLLMLENLLVPSSTSNAEQSPPDT